MRAALDRRSASTMIIISIRWSFVGAHVDCSTKTSFPRTFSRSSTITSPSLNFETVAFPSCTFRCFATFCASRGLALPVNTIRLSKAIVFSRDCCLFRAGEEGFEPSNAGIKIRCLNQLGDSPTAAPLPGRGYSNQLAHRVAFEPARDETLHPFRQGVDHALRGLAALERGEDA